MQFYLLLLLIHTFCPTNLFAQSDAEQNIYMVKQQESLDILAVKLLPKFRIKYGKRIDDLKQDLREWNPQITNWSAIPAFSNIYIEYPYPPYLSYHVAQKLELGKNYNALNSDAETPRSDNHYVVFASYTASASNFQEQLTSQTGNIKSAQNSPLTLGLGTTIFLNKNIQMLNTSISWASISTSNLSGTNVTSPKLDASPEYGANIYYQHMSPWSDLSFYTGIDYEQISTFNTSDYIQGAALAFNRNKFFYGSFGIGKKFYWGDQKIILKGTFSEVLKSNTSASNSNDKLTGQRLSIFTSMKGESRFTYHLLFKRYILTGPTKITINQMGFGFSFVLF